MSKKEKNAKMPAHRSKKKERKKPDRCKSVCTILMIVNVKPLLNSLIKDVCSRLQLWIATLPKRALFS